MLSVRIFAFLIIECTYNWSTRPRNVLYVTFKLKATTKSKDLNVEHGTAFFEQTQ